MIKRILSAGLALVLVLGVSASSPAPRVTPDAGSTTVVSANAPTSAAPAASIPRPSVPVIPKTPVDTRLVIVRAKPGADVSAVVGKAKPVNGNYVLPVPKGTSTASFTADLAGSGRFEYATEDHEAYVLGYTSTPNDPDFNNANQYGIAQSGYAYVPYAKSWWVSDHAGSGNTASPDFDLTWPYLTPDGATVAYDARATAAQVKVAVIDTGFYFNTPDVGPNIVAGKDEFETFNGSLYTTDMDVTPTSGGDDPNHGTMVACEIAQATNNGVGGAAAGYDTQVRVYKVQGLRTDVSPARVVILDSAITNAIYDATNDGCRVITMSLGSDQNDTAMQTAITYAWQHGVVVCAASGNDDASTVYFPAANNHVIGVGSYSLTSGGTGTPVRSEFSNYGTGLDILAPGDALWGPIASYPGNYWWSGTSMASPLVAAAAALTIRFAPGISTDGAGADEITDILQKSAVDIGTAGYDTTNGWGCLNMQRAYNTLKSRYPNLTKPVLSGVTTGGAYASHTVPVSWAPIAGYQVQYGVSKDGAAPTTSSATSVSLTNLADGPHSVRVEPVSTRNWSAGSAVTVTFTVDTVAPAAPTVSYTSFSRTIHWNTSEAAGTAQVAIDATSNPVTAPSSGYVVPNDVADGSHIAYVRIVDAAGNIGAWGQAAFAIGTNPPLAPVLSWDAAAQRLTWTPGQPGVTTQFALDDPATATTISATFWTPAPGTPYGSHTAYVRMTDAGGNVGPWGTLIFSVADPATQRASLLSFSTPVSLIVAWGSPVTISGTLLGTDTLPVAGNVVVSRSLNGGGTWSSVATVTTDANGAWSADLVPGRNMLVRAFFPGDAVHTPTFTGEDVSILQRVYLSSPHTPGTVTHGHAFTTYAYLKPRFTSGSKPVTFRFYRWEKHNGVYAWTLRKTSSGKAANYSSYTKCSVSTSVPYAGKWRVKVRYAGSSTYVETISGYSSTFTAR